jgi:hypothetical protein
MGHRLDHTDHLQGVGSGQYQEARVQTDAFRDRLAASAELGPDRLNSGAVHRFRVVT